MIRFWRWLRMVATGMHIAFMCDCDGYHACDYHYAREVRERILRP